MMLFHSRRALSVGMQVSKRNFAGAVQNLRDFPAVQDFLKTSEKCVLYYTAKWCGPCRNIAPVYEELAQNSENIKLGKVDVDTNSEAAHEALIRAVPTFKSFHNNEMVKEIQGADPEALKDMVEDLKAK